jgi:tRNA pseudouridine32 synthase/23S rRNA pseudouridine746 synthase/23S rRNA pseudouridine1911/1915/1917 synthase
VQVVHRLDQDTSGVMLFALSHDGYTKLKEIFEKHDIERAYSAIVEGVVKPESGTWTSYLFEDERYHVHSSNDPEKGRVAITHYSVKSASQHYSLLEVKLETGRKNQIRVHCKDAGCPIVGDKKYGNPSSTGKRLYLHAHLLAFEHPITGKSMRFVSPAPKSFFYLVPAVKSSEI